MPHRLLLRFGMSPRIALALCFAGRLAWPVGLSTTVGATAIENYTTVHPYVNFVLISAVIQLFIQLMRSWFAERRDILERYNARLKEEMELRHKMANQMSAQNLIIFALMKTAPPELVLELTEIYKEQTGVHETESPHKSPS